MKTLPPINKVELMKRANTLAGITIQQLASKMHVDVPESLVHAKGWFGNLLEHYLGAEAASAAKPDFINLNIELKTIPIDENGKPKESTYICVVQLDPVALSSWDNSLVKHKLTEVLWIPFEASKTIPVALRRIGTPVLWKPDTKQERQLKQDWQELCDLIVLGEIDKISSTMGSYLQIRPKAANARSLTIDKNQSSLNTFTLPRGFYLRPSFTHSIVTS
ncbi:MAG: DNA mismatch repair endonuclease MutH [Proteobacteria bacterium]|nr:DNA mismatch repair endonuclease MutH [Pseudomonadota bacterium]NOG60810.1 DNA mismatch repair endonuclease MutH [Pseudomonadota bacterium]